MIGFLQRRLNITPEHLNQAGEWSTAGVDDIDWLRSVNDDKRYGGKRGRIRFR